MKYFLFILLLLSIIITIFGFYIDRTENYPFVLKIVDRDFYYTKEAINFFYQNPEGILSYSEPAFEILCNKYFSECDNAFGIGRTGMQQFLGNISIGSDFELILNPEKGVLKSGVFFTHIQKQEHNDFEQKVHFWGVLMFWIGITLSLVIGGANFVLLIFKRSTKNTGLSKIEKRIREIQKMLSGGIEKEMEDRCKNRGVIMPAFDRMVEAKKKPLIQEKEILELKRQHKLDRRNSWLPKSIWNILVPIVVAVITTYLLKVFV